MPKKRRRKSRQRNSQVPQPMTKRAGALVRGPAGRVAGVVGLCLLVFVTLWWWNQSSQRRDAPPHSEFASANRHQSRRSTDHDRTTQEPENNQDSDRSNSQSGAREIDESSDTQSDADSPLSGSFLESFGSTAPTVPENETTKSDESLERSFRNVLAAMDERAELKNRMSAALGEGDLVQLTQLRTDGLALAERLNGQLSRLEADLKLARDTRPDDPLVQWLTGELLMLVGGEPTKMLPYFQRAVEKGLQRARLFASLARVQLEANQFAASYDSALQALEWGQPDQYVWETYDRVARSNQRFHELTKRLVAAFPDPPRRPAWMAEMHQRAVRLEGQWNEEIRLRQGEEAKNDLPRVRLAIEHRRFALDADGNSTSRIETTGQGQVELELFEDQAPKTVANFISLVEKGFYNGTLFMVAESARYVRAGDPNTRNRDPEDDGDGGPGYVIADEYQRSDARHHFRGSVSMVNTGPHTAGSQFFITLAPNESFDGHFTVFGRVIQGQQVVDEITPGRTSANIGHFGKLIPGDVMLMAEVIRKRPHPYYATTPSTSRTSN